MHLAALQGHNCTVNFLIYALPEEERLSFIYRQDRCGATALHWAALQINPAVVEDLVRALSPAERLAFINVQDRYGATAQDKAISYGRMDVVALLRGYEAGLAGGD